MAKEQTKKENKKSFLRDDLYTFYVILSKLKSNKLNRETMVKYIPFRVKLKTLIADPYEAIRTEASEQTKPEGFDELSQEQQKTLLPEWEKRIFPILDKWLKEKVEFTIGKLFSMEELIDLFDSNPEITGGQMDIISKYLLKDEVE